MKNKILLISCGILVLSAIIALIFLIPIFNKTDKFSSDNISFNIDTSNNTLYSGLKYDGSCESYTLKIKSINNIEIINPEIKFSQNVNISNKTTNSNSLEYIFNIVNIKNKNSIEITFLSDNFETIKKIFNVVPFVNSINLNFYTPNQEFNSQVELSQDNQSRNILYFLKDNSFLSQATSDKYYSQLNYKIISNNKNFSNFEITLSNDSLIIDKQTNTIKTNYAFERTNQNFEQCVVTIKALDGSDYFKKFNFVIKEIYPTNILGLPTETITLDVLTNNTYSFDNISIIPEYSYFDLEKFLTYDKNYFRFIKEENKLKALKSGEQEVKIYIEQTNFEKIINFVINPSDSNSTYNYELSLSNTNSFISYNNQTKTINVTNSELTENCEINIIIAVVDNNGNYYDFNTNISHTNNIILEYSIHNNPNNQNSKLLNICINTTQGSDTITLKLIIDSTTIIEETIYIISN